MKKNFKTGKILAGILIICILAGCGIYVATSDSRQITEHENYNALSQKGEVEDGYDTSSETQIPTNAKEETQQADTGTSNIYMTTDISPKGLQKV